MSRHEIEDGMGFAGLAPSADDLREERLRAEIARLQSECAIARKREQDAWAERDQYMNSNVKLVAEIERLRDENQRYATAHKQLQVALELSQSQNYRTLCGTLNPQS